MHGLERNKTDLNTPFSNRSSSLLLYFEQLNLYLRVILSYVPWSWTGSIQQRYEITRSDNFAFHSCLFTTFLFRF